MLRRTGAFLLCLLFWVGSASAEWSASEIDALLRLVGQQNDRLDAIDYSTAMSYSAVDGTWVDVGHIKEKTDDMEWHLQRILNNLRYTLGDDSNNEDRLIEVVRSIARNVATTNKFATVWEEFQGGVPGPSNPAGQGSSWPDIVSMYLATTRRLSPGWEFDPDAAGVFTNSESTGSAPVDQWGVMSYRSGAGLSESPNLAANGEYTFQDWQADAWKQRQRFLEDGTVDTTALENLETNQLATVSNAPPLKIDEIEVDTKPMEQGVESMFDGLDGLVPTGSTSQAPEILIMKGKGGKRAGGGDITAPLDLEDVSVATDIIKVCWAVLFGVGIVSIVRTEWDYWSTLGGSAS